NKNHPTVDMIYKELVNEIPTLSKTTVYNKLKLFHEKGIIIIVNIEDNETRFDADTSNHGHFKCIKCEKIYDFELTQGEINFPKLLDFSINEKHVYFKGICPDCKYTMLQFIVGNTNDKNKITQKYDLDDYKNLKNSLFSRALEIF
ncbi:MAG: transcriptional repressor, partial [Bacteroidales bacterium]|nr:transcriptional repressor [Bacteroidales bacterium]